jgi:hypothetical protein
MKFGTAAVLVSGALLVFSPGARAQAGLIGIWDGRVSGPQGLEELVLAFSFDQFGLITGTFADDPELETVPIEDLAVEDDMVTFRTRRTLDGNETTITWAGALDEDQMRLVREIETVAFGGGEPRGLRARGPGVRPGVNRVILFHRRPDPQ